MGFSEKDIRRMAPWAQEQVAVQMVRKKNRGRTPHPSPAVTPSPQGEGKFSPSVLPAASHLPHQREAWNGECGGDGKYRAKKAVRLMPNGEKHVFDSQKEARRYDELAMLAAVGAIRDLRLQVLLSCRRSVPWKGTETMRFCGRGRRWKVHSGNKKPRA